MDFRVVRKYFYQRWRGHAIKNNIRREIVFLLLGAPRHALGFGNLLRLTFIRVNSVLDDNAILALFIDKEMSQFVKFAIVLPPGQVVFDLTMLEILKGRKNNHLSTMMTYLDLPKIYHEIGVDLAAAGPDPMAAPEAFYLKLLWPDYVDSDEKYVAIMIAGILSTRCSLDQNSVNLPPNSMHLTEVGMHLKSLEAVDATLAWALPSLKNEGLRLARFLGKDKSERYFSVTDSPCHHSDKVVSLNSSVIRKDARRLWSLHDIEVDLHLYQSVQGKTLSTGCTEEHLAFITRDCAELALLGDIESEADDVEDEAILAELDDLHRFMTTDTRTGPCLNTRLPLVDIGAIENRSWILERMYSKKSIAAAPAGDETNEPENCYYTIWRGNDTAAR